MRRVVGRVLILSAFILAGSLIFCAFLPEPNHEPQTGTTIFVSDSGYRISGMVWHEQAGLVVTTYRINRNPNTSRVYFNAQNGKGVPYSNDAETIGQPVIVDNVIYFPQEHGDKCLYWDGQWQEGITSPGRWCVSAFEYQGRPAMSFNNNFRSEMGDQPRIVDPVRGTPLFVVPAKMMPRSMAEWKGDWWVAGDTGEDGTYTPGRKYAGDITHMAVMNGKLYGGGKDGSISRMGPNGWTDRVATEAGVSMHMMSTGHKIYYTGGRPNRLYSMTRGGLRLMSREESPDSGDNYFGNAVAVDSDTVYWAYWNAVRSRGIVVRLDG